MFLSRLAERSGIFDFLAPASDSKEDENNNRPTRNRGGHGMHADKNRRRHRLGSQLEAERIAEGHGVFVKYQRVLYHNKTKNTHHDAYVVGVHFDDGPDHPYYTIKYSKKEVITGDDNTEKEFIAEVEKQTQPDRLTRVPWDENKSWEILQKK